MAIIPIKEINIIELTPRKLPVDIQKGIESYWNGLLTKWPRMFNGPVYSVVQMENDDNKLTLQCELSNYAHYKYSEIQDLGEYACRNTYAGCVVVSSDNEAFVSLNGEDSEFVGKIQVIGGAIDPNDRIIGGAIHEGDNSEQNRISPVVTALRELEEEAGDEIRESITDIGKSYLVTNGEKYGIHTVVYSSLKSKAIFSAFENFKKKTGNNEIDKLISFGKDDQEKLQKYEACQDLEVVNLLRTLMGRTQSAYIGQH